MTHRRLSILVATAIATAGLVVLPGQYPANSQSSPLSPLTERRVATGWIPWWDLDEGLVSVEDHPRVFSEVSLFWFSATAQSTLQNAQNNNMDETSLVDAVQRLHAVGVRALPTVTDFAVDPKAMSRLLSDKARRAALVAEIVGMVGRVDADGVDIDFERINNTSGRSRTSVRRTFPLFLGRLHQRLARKGWLLSVSLPARTSDRDPNWSVFSYRAIAPTVDRARIQTYNFHYSQGSPGPLAPLAWVNTVARYAKARFGRVPVFLGQPTTGLNWYVKRLSGTCPPSEDVTATAAPTVAQAVALAESYGADIRWDAVSGEYHFRYRRPYVVGADSCLTVREVWFEDGRSVAKKLDIVRRQGVQGLAFWTLGVEDPKTWDRVRQYAANRIPAPARTRLRAPKSVDLGSALRITARFRVAGQPVVARQVSIQRRLPQRQWKTVDKQLTGSRGGVTFVVLGRRSADWRVRLPAAWDWRTTVTRSARVTVR